MNPPRIEALEKLLGTPRDGSVLRFALGTAYLDLEDHRTAALHLSESVRLDPTYTAAWKRLGQAQLAMGLENEAAQSWARGLKAAEARGDKQAAKEMTVFLRRLARKSAP